MKRLILSTLYLLATATALFAQNGITFEVVAPTAVEAGERFNIEFVVNNAAPQNVEFTPPTIEGFEVLAGPVDSYSSHSTVDFTTGTSTSVEATTYTYVVRGISAGLHTISAAKATVAGKSYSTKPVTIEVVGEADRSAGAQTGQREGSAPEISSEDVFVRATVSRAEVYKGEPVYVTLKLYRRGINISGLGEIKLPTFNGFWQQDITVESAPQRETYNNRVYDTYVLKEYLLYPQQSGTLTIEPFEAVVNAFFQERSSGSPFDDLFGGYNIREVNKKIGSQPVLIEVRELPTADAPESFDNAVGEFKLEVTPPPSTVNANTSGTYTVRLSGTGNFPLIIRAPKLSLPPSFEQYNVTTSDNTRHTRTGTNGYKEFSYPFIPRSDGLYAIPAFEFSYFNPRKRIYETLSFRDVSIEVAADSTALVGPGGGGLMSGVVSKEDLRIFGQDIRFIKRGGAELRPKGHTFMFSTLYTSLVALLVAVFVAGFLILPRYLRNMQSDHFVRGKRANKLALKRFRAAETSMKRDDRHGFYDEMLKALWGYIGDKFDIPMSDLTKERIREELFERNIPEAQSLEYIRIISECEEAQYSPVSSSRMGELYREGVALVSELESTTKRI